MDASKINDIPVAELIRSAMEARKKAYAPYSGYMVGAAVLTNELRIYTGCNIENAAYTPTVCAERTAVFKAVSEGHRKFKRIAIATAGEKMSGPCGVCRQVLHEFAPDLEIILINCKNETVEYTLPQLLPHSFGPADLA